VRMPAAYTVVGGARVRAAIRRDLVAALRPWLLAPRLVLPPEAEPLSGGRGGTYRLRLPDGLRIVVRLYRRGGFAARFSHDRYLGVRARPLRELVVTAEARRRGVPAVEVLAARVEGRLAYRGALVTAEVAARTLIDALRTAPDASARAALAASAGHAIRALHDAGVFHADLNLTNLLVPGADGVLLLDFDRARLHRPPLGGALRRRNLARLARSARKLDPEGALVGRAERAAFLATYAAGASPAVAQSGRCDC